MLIMHNMKRVSIVIIMYNAKRYIVPCLSSVLGSRGATIDEVVVIDNASSNGTIGLVREYFSNDLVLSS